MSEQRIQREILLQYSRGDWRMFRNHTGMGWSGRVVERTGNRVVLEDARPLNAGLCVGSSDLIGWHSIIVRPEHVGQRIAVFSAIEVKSETGRPTREQQAFIDTVNRFGGYGVVARDRNEVVSPFLFVCDNESSRG